MSTILEDAPTTTILNQDRSDLGDASRVTILNDDVNSFEGVAMAISMVIPGKSFEDGLEHATQIHFEGQSVVWSGHREVAEHYTDLFKRAGLTVAEV